jgi:predicted RND superfamily exporter protein
MAGNIVAILLLGLMLLVGLGLALVVLLVVGGALLEVRSHARGRRPPSSYARHLRAAERGRHRRRRRRGSKGHGITIFLDMLPPELGKRKP